MKEEKKQDLENKILEKQVEDLKTQQEASIQLTADTVNAISAIHEKLESLTKAIHNPVSIRSSIDPPDPESQDLHFNDHGIIERPRVVDVDSPEFKAKAEQTAIDQSMVKIRVEETPRDDDMEMDTRFMVSINGMPLTLREGQEYDIPVAFLVALYRNRRTKVGSKEYVDNADGKRKVKYPTNTSQRHPISVLECSNKKARDYIQKVRSGVL